MRDCESSGHRLVGQKNDRNYERSKNSQLIILEDRKRLYESNHKCQDHGVHESPMKEGGRCGKTSKIKKEAGKRHPGRVVWISNVHTDGQVPTEMIWIIFCRSGHSTGIWACTFATSFHVVATIYQQTINVGARKIRDGWGEDVLFARP